MVNVTNQIFVPIFVGVVVALITAIINQIFEGKVNLLWVIGGCIAAGFLYGIYVMQHSAPPFVIVAGILGVVLLLLLLIRAYLAGYGQVPYIKWRVELDPEKWGTMQGRRESCPGLISDGDPIREGGEVVCRFASRDYSYGVYGPYIEYLPKGKYRATFRVKASEALVKLENQHLTQIDVVAKRGDILGDRTLNKRDLSYSDFKKAQKYYFFSLDFEAADGGERKVEFRVSTPNIGSDGFIMTLDYIQLYRRLF